MSASITRARTVVHRIYSQKRDFGAEGPGPMRMPGYMGSAWRGYT